MALLSKIVTVWSGTPVVGGGVNVFYCASGDEHGLMTAWRVFLADVALLFPIPLVWTFPAAGAVINEVNGQLVGAWSDPTPPAILSATGNSTWANGVGARVKWLTGEFINGHQVTGATFLVPLVVGAYEGSGNITDANVAAFNTKLATMVSTSSQRIWVRPTEDTVGTSFLVTAGQVPDKVSWLRTRRT